MPPLTTEELTLLRKHDTPTVCNVIELFDIRPRISGYMDERIQACFPEMPPMVGYAATATFRASHPAQGDVYASLEDQVTSFEEHAGPTVVVFQDLDDPMVAATFGEIMCTTYKSFGAVGLITSGAGRDLDQVRAIDFPVFTNGTICSHGYSHTLAIQIPVHVGGITINPGDLLHGDCNGVTTIPLDIAGQVARACDAFMEAEAVILNYLKDGAVSRQGLADARAKCSAMIAALKERVQNTQ